MNGTGNQTSSFPRKRESMFDNVKMGPRWSLPRQAVSRGGDDELFAFAYLVDAVLRDLDREVPIFHDRLAGQARLRLEAPGAVEQIVLVFARGIERGESVAHDHVTGGAGAGFFAGVLDLDSVVEQIVANGNAAFPLDGRTFRTDFGVRQDLDRR